jgi:poly-gamma-glutamate capsule biosynthesis protein CapA/YwtB (metallophosphatase superfamily)
MLLKSKSSPTQIDSNCPHITTHHSGSPLRVMLILIPAALMFLCLEPWGLQASYRQDVQPFVYETSLEIVAVGDIMMHLSQVKSAYDEKKDRYDFSPQFSEIKDQISRADIAIGNLETTFTPGQKMTGYPKFNTPAALARDLKKTGFDLLVTANNHSLDYGEDGIIGTLDALKKNGLIAVGTGRSWEDEMQPVIVERNDIKVAFLAYTCGTNGVQLPEKKPYLLKLFSKKQVAKDVAAAQRGGVDLILAYIHFGAEYERFPGTEQYKIASVLRQSGVHIVLGSHPHVIQPENKRLSQKQYTLFSLGNFISGQRTRFTDIGLMLNLRLVKRHPAGVTTIEQVSYTPTYVKRSWKKAGVDYSVVPLQQVDKHLSKLYRSKMTYNKVSLRQDVLGHIRGGVYLEKPETTRSTSIQ